MDAFIASKEMQVPRKKLVKRPNREKRAKKLKKGVAKRAGVWYYTWAPSAETKEWLPKSQLRSERKEPIDAEKFRFVPRNLKRSKFKTFEMLRKKCLTKNHFCDKIIKSSAGRLRRTGPWKLNNIEKLVRNLLSVWKNTVNNSKQSNSHRTQAIACWAKKDLTLFKW